MSNEMIAAVLTAVTAAGGVLSGAVAKMWLFFHNELLECKKDRRELGEKIEVMHSSLGVIERQIGRLEGKTGHGKNDE